MKHYTFIIVILFCCINSCFAQRMKSWTFTADDYNTDTLRMDGYTYICDTLKHTRITLRNITDHPGREEICYADGTPLEDELASGLKLNAVVITKEIMANLHKIVDEAFSREQVESLNEEMLRISLNISSSSGEITDIYFNYLAFHKYAQIPIEVYRNIEMRMKNEVVFQLTDLGHRLNYCLLTWRQCPKGREDSGMTIPEDGGGVLTMPGGKLDGTIGGTIGTPSTTPTMP